MSNDPSRDPWLNPPRNEPQTAPERAGEQRSFVDLYSAFKEQDRLFNELEGMKEEIGKAKAIREISGDYRKKILANLMEPFLKDHGVGAAETLARSTKTYAEDLASHQRDLSQAEAVLARKEWIEARLEALRTIISTEKALLQMQ